MDVVLNRLKVEKGEILFHEGTSGDCAYIIESGSIEISVNRNGRNVIIDRRLSGEFVGEMAIIDSKPRSATATACESSELFVIHRHQFERRMKNADPVLKMVMGIILDRFRETLLRLEKIEDKTEKEAFTTQAVEKIGVQCHSSALREIRLEREMNHALNQGEFVPFFQPIVYINEKKICGYEALIRWNHPVKGIVAPSMFLPTAEACGMISAFTQTIFSLSTAFLKKLHNELRAESGALLPYISINISGLDLLDSAFVGQLLTKVSDTGIDTKYINLEITETMLLADPDGVIAKLTSLREAGFSISLDDFGTGYSSLSYLHRFPVDSLKVDQFFVGSMEESATNLQIIKSILMLAEQLNLKVITEGIEKRSQLLLLKQLGCEFGQGYYFSRPVPQAEVMKLWR